jgi:hypothetical protein
VQIGGKTNSRITVTATYRTETKHYCEKRTWANMSALNYDKKFAQIWCFLRRNPKEIVTRQALHLTELVCDISNLLGAKILALKNFPRHS